ncbi:hypothetical protein [Polaromonas sp.]|uniref:hypothetical protein n=1 Tax=Polaromonas sp. TaxID=1869339 RepID=UPI0032660791
MTGIVITSFRGKVPKVSTRLLSDTSAVVATDCVLTSGKLVPINRPGLSHTSMAVSIASMYRYRFGEILNWLTSINPVDWAKSSTSQDAMGRIFYTGDGEPRMTTYADAIIGPGPYPAGWYVLGVTPPVTAPGVAVVGGVAPTEARAYVYTFATRFGEESGPSPATLFTGNVDGSWDLTAMDIAPPNTGAVTTAVADTPSAGFAQVTQDSTFGVVPGEWVVYAGIGGLTDLNGRFKVLSVTGLNVVVELATAQVYTAGGTWTREAPHNKTGMVKRIYRTVGTGVDYKFVAEIPVADATYSDTVVATDLAETIPSLFTLTPPKAGHSIIALANGAHAMLAGNELCMSEPYKPHSWPLANRYSFPAVCVALSASLNSVIVLTDSYPYFVTATVPEAASPSRGETYAPCVAKRGVVHTGDGCLYPGHDGLYSITASGAKNVTLGMYRKKEWKALLPETFRAAFNSLGYYAVHEDNDGAKSIWFLDAAEPDGCIDYSEVADALYSNEVDGDLYLSIGDKIYLWDGDPANRKTMYWRSKDFQMPHELNFAAGQLKAQYREVVPINTTVQDENIALMADADNVDGEIASAEVLVYEVAASAIQQVSDQTAGFAQMILIRNGAPIYTKAMTSDRPFRWPGGFRDDVYALGIAANITVDAVYSAESMEELGQVP